MTRKEMEELLARLLEEQRFDNAAIQPLNGDISYEKVVKSLFNDIARRDLKDKE